MTSAALPICIAAFYKFTPIADPVALRHRLGSRCTALDLKGTLLIAPEGVNGTIAGSDAAIAEIVDLVRALPGFDPMDVKLSRARVLPFGHMKVRLRREIVTMGRPDIDPLVDVGHYVDPADWNALIDDPGTIVIDTRNDYEVALGSFAGAIDPGTRSFRDFPGWFQAFRSARERDGPLPRVAMFCTGGIRCEKATAFLKAEGVEDVYHLKGGILAYLEAIAPEDSRWHGDCFVFDERVTVTERLSPGDQVLCRRCQRPIAGAGCAHCDP